MTGLSRADRAFVDILSAVSSGNSSISRRRAISNAARLTEIDDEIAAIRENLLELTEQAAARSGAADEEFAAERIAQQEARIAFLTKQRDALVK
jgi:hypothetical protein